jgi:hypothetical protein
MNKTMFEECGDEILESLWYMPKPFPSEQIVKLNPDCEVV